MDLEQIFDNNADCYTDVQKINTEEYEWTTEQAMTKEKFIEVVKKLNIHDVSNASEFEGVCYQEARYNTRCNEFCGDNDTCGC